MVPALDRTEWPTLGPQICAHIEQTLVFGPGDLLGQRAKLDAEKSSLVCRMYEVYPRKHKWAGRRRFARCGISLRKGSAKTELAAWIAACELHHEGPVRCVGWDRWGEPIGGAVKNPYIPMVSYSEEQSEDLAYGALLEILKRSEIANHFDIGIERIMRVKGDGTAKPLAAAPSAREGARTTWQHFDETWLFTSPRLKKAHATMLLNLPKRKAADPWALETTTAPEPGAGSVAEDTMNYARSVAAGKAKDAKLFFFHREASDTHDLATRKGVTAAVKEASGALNVRWADVDRIVDQFFDPTLKTEDLRQRWLNQSRVPGATRALNIVKWRELAKPDYRPKDGALITLGFDGARRRDATAVIGTEIETGFQWKVGIWEKPYSPNPTEWEVPEAEVRGTVAAVFARFQVWRFYADPYWWETVIGEWCGEYGEEVVIRWPTTRWAKMSAACLAYANAIESGELSNDGDSDFERHIANACRKDLPGPGPDGERQWIMQKERPDSPNKMDGAMGGCLSWQARTDARTLGIGRPIPEQSYTVEWIG
jgi:hypothetical protein